MTIFETQISEQSSLNL